METCIRAKKSLLDRIISPAALTILRFYHKYISQFFPRTCRFVPTCSEYMMEAIEKKGIILGTAKGVIRLIRCHPFNPGGYDPLK